MHTVVAAVPNSGWNPETRTVTTVSGISPVRSFLVGDFRVTLPGADASRITAVRGIHMSVPKVASTPVGQRHQFVPGAPQFDGIQFEAGAGGATLSDLQTWANNIAQGVVDLRMATLTFLSPDFSKVLGTLDFVNLSPISFPPFTNAINRRTMDLAVGSFRFQ